MLAPALRLESADPRIATEVKRVVKERGSNVYNSLFIAQNRTAAPGRGCGGVCCGPALGVIGCG